MFVRFCWHFCQVYVAQCSSISLLNIICIILILKIRKLKSVGVRSTVDAEAIGTEAIDAEVINTVDPWGWGGSMINIEAIDVEAIDTEAINTVDPGGRSMINIEVIDAEAINTVEPGGINNWHRESTFKWKIQKIFNYFSCMLVLKLFTFITMLNFY